MLRFHSTGVTTAAAAAAAAAAGTEHLGVNYSRPFSPLFPLMRPAPDEEHISITPRPH